MNRTWDYGTMLDSTTLKCKIIQTRLDKNKIFRRLDEDQSTRPRLDDFVGPVDQTSDRKCTRRVDVYIEVYIYHRRHSCSRCIKYIEQVPMLPKTIQLTPSDINLSSLPYFDQYKVRFRVGGNVNNYSTITAYTLAIHKCMNVPSYVVMSCNICT